MNQYKLGTLFWIFGLCAVLLAWYADHTRLQPNRIHHTSLFKDFSVYDSLKRGETKSDFVIQRPAGRLTPNGSDTRVELLDCTTLDSNGVVVPLSLKECRRITENLVTDIEDALKGDQYLTTD